MDEERIPPRGYAREMTEPRRVTEADGTVWVEVEEFGGHVCRFKVSEISHVGRCKDSGRTLVQIGNQTHLANCRPNEFSAAMRGES